MPVRLWPIARARNSTRSVLPSMISRRNRSNRGALASGSYTTGQIFVMLSSARWARSAPVFKSIVPFSQLNAHLSVSKSSGSTRTTGSDSAHQKASASFRCPWLILPHFSKASRFEPSSKFTA